jgi:CheY-like chemotaxis protein/nitrogen-specific signal transduction histidine kinase
MNDVKNRQNDCNITKCTELENAKKEILLLSSRLSEAEKMNRKKNMLFEDVAGNIRLNMNNIIGKAVIAKTRPDTVDKNADSITESARAVIDLVNNVLDITMIEERKLFLNELQFEIGEFFENIKSSAIPTARAKSQKLNVSYKNITHSSVIGDSARLETIFSNLLSITIKYTPTGGVITLVVTETSFNERLCNFSVRIFDNGIGIAKEKQGNTFPPYSIRGKLGGGGDGDGLTLANELIKLLGGDIRVESNTEIGTNVYVNFALKPDNFVEFIDSKPEYSFEGKIILLVEDNEISRDMFAEMLESEGAVVEKADSGRTAVEIFENSPVFHFDIIFMDIAMPDMDGVEATKQIRTLFRPDAKSITIIALTAKTPGEEVARGLNVGMDAYEQKPFDISRIRHLLTELNV